MVSYGGHQVHIKEGALGDGVGAKLWLVARFMCSQIANGTVDVTDKTVLEIGAGVGACGFLSGKMEAKAVLVTDYVDTLLLNLREALHLNFPSLTANEDQVSAKDPTPGQPDGPDTPILNSIIMKTDDHDESWTRDHVGVRFIDWDDSLRLEQGTLHHQSSAVAGGPLDGTSSRKVAPGVPKSLTFDVIIGTDVLYEWPMTESLPAVIHHRLAPGGRAFICNAVRDQAMCDSLIQNIQDRGFDVHIEKIDPEAEASKDTVCKGHYHDYEGGYIFMTIMRPPT